MLALIGSLAALPSAAPAAAAGETEDLVFLVDGSGSISAEDWRVQKDGLAAALQDRLAFPRDGSFAVGVVQWSYVSREERTRVEVPLTVLDEESDVSAVVERVQGMAQLGSSTNPGDGVRRGTDLLREQGEAAAEWSLCMSTDGTTNSGESLSSALSHARSSGVDRFSVIGIEDPPFVDAAALRTHYGPHVYGGGSVTIARNAIEFGNLIVGGCLGDAVALRALEVNQAVQDWQGSVPLVTGKATGVRAFVEVAPGQDDQRVIGRLYGRRGGVDLPGSPLLAINPGSSIVARPDVVSRRGDLAASLNFSLPPSWRSGEVRLEFDAAGAPVDCEEPSTSGPPGDPARNCAVTVRFGDEVRPETVFVGVDYTDGGSTSRPTTSELLEQVYRFRSILPVRGLDYRLDRMGGYSSRPSLETVNTHLAIKRFFDVFGCLFGCSDPTTWDSRYYGVLRGNGGGLANDIPGTVSSGFLSGTGARGDTGYARNRGPHELAHSLGRHHAVDNSLPLNGDGDKVGRCSEVADPSAPGHSPFETVGGNVRPVLGPLSSGVDREVWGLDHRFLFNNTSSLAVVDPRVTFELLSYCGGGPQGRWISEFTYRGVQGSFPGSSASSSGTGDAGGEHLVVTGTIDASGRSATLGPVLPLTGNPPAPQRGDAEVRLLDAAGAVLASAAFAPEEMDADAPAPETPTGPPVGMVVVPLPRPATPVATVELLNDGEVVGTRTASATPPTVAVTRPVAGAALTEQDAVLEWSSSDADGDALTHTVLYSADGGRSWDTLAVGTPARSLTLPRRELSGSTAAVLRVIASDGVHSTTADSAPFSVAGAPPEVEVDAPQDRAVVSGLQDLELRGTAFDGEDGQLQGAALVWSSDRDGGLGTGEEVSVNAADLSEGEHVLSLTATDSSGATASDTVRVTVFRVAPPPEPPALEARVEVKPGSDPAPVNTRSSGVVPVAVLTTDVLDAMAVDPASVCFGAASDPAGAGDCSEAHGRGHAEDVDGDGRTDLVLHFETRETGIRPGDTSACLVGRTRAGRAVEGCDAIRAH